MGRPDPMVARRSPRRFTRVYLRFLPSELDLYLDFLDLKPALFCSKGLSVSRSVGAGFAII